MPKMLVVTIGYDTYALDYPGDVAHLMQIQERMQKVEYKSGGGYQRVGAAEIVSNVALYEIDPISAEATEQAAVVTEKADDPLPF